MKYIRMKEYGVCKVINEDKHALSYENSYVCGCLWKDDYKDQIQYANTIEELCDRCVVIHKYGEQPKDMSFYEAQYFIDVWTRKVKSNDPIVAIYGAIWTDKGLIYVAKMNEEGELELL